jgi:hypothetical protein
MGANINGPSLIRTPAWADGALGRYHLYFAHHKGSYIRMAYAEQLQGPWRIHTPGCLSLARTGFSDHIASPDVHVEEANRRIIMYYHGCCRPENLLTSQPSRVAVSTDGVHFDPVGGDIGRPYFRVFNHGGLWYAVLNRGWLYRSSDPLAGWEEGGRLALPEATRHVAVHVVREKLRVFFSVRGDAPEHIMMCVVDLRDPWPHWNASSPMSVLRPARPWEGADLPIVPSETGRIDDPVHQARDPAIYEEDGRTFLLYSVAGEAGIGIAELEEE